MKLTSRILKIGISSARSAAHQVKQTASVSSGIDAVAYIGLYCSPYCLESFCSFGIPALELQHLVKISLLRYLTEALREYKAIDKADVADQIVNSCS